MITENKIPRHWKMASLVDDLPFIKTGVLEFEGIKKYYSTGSIKSDSITEEGEYNFNLKPSRANRIGKKGDVLQARMKNTQKAVLINSNLEGQLFSTGFFQIRGIENMLSSKYIYYYLTSSTFNQIKDELCSGSTQSALNDENAKKIFIPIAPFHEQELITYKIEELFSELDKGIEDLKTAQQQLKTYRQSVLKWAFEGKLTNKKVKKGELPKGWKTEELANLAEMRLGKMLDKNKNKGNYHYYLGNISVRWGTFDLDNLSQMRFEESEEERYELKEGDLVICEGGEPGRCAIWKKDFVKMKIQKALHRVRVKNILSVKFLYHFMFYSGTTGLLEKYFTGTTIKHLTGNGLKKVCVPLPPIKEQHQIVQEIESRLSIADKMEESISLSLIQAEALKQSILNKAFSGELVKQVTDGEPVSQLIIKIKEEKLILLKEEKDRFKLLIKKNQKMPEKSKTIIEILMESTKPISSKILWQSSVHKKDIDSFYAQLKILIDEGKIRETVRDGKETFIELIEN